MTSSNRFALAAILGFLVISGVVFVWAFLVLRASVAPTYLVWKRSGVCGLTLPMDKKFGDQFLKSTVALLEIYKVRHGRYPDRLSDLDFAGDWDRLTLTKVAYRPNKDRTRYYVEVTSGWVCKPILHYPDEFWSGTGYDPSIVAAKGSD
jgi:hypothetical protein